MRSYHKSITKSKFERVRANPKALICVRGSGITTVAGSQKYRNRSNGPLLLGEFTYTKQYNVFTSKYEYYRTRMKPVDAYVMDYGYYEHRLQLEEQKKEKV